MTTERLFDTDILLDYLQGNPKAADILLSSKTKYISILTYFETLLCIDHGDSVREEVKRWLLTFDIIKLDVNIIDQAFEYLKDYKIGLIDAMMVATAKTNAADLISRNPSYIDEMALIKRAY